MTVVATLISGAFGATPVLGRRAATAVATSAPLLVNEPFNTTASTPSLWTASGDACLTAGGSTTPATSIAPCGAAAPVDAAGSGALQLTTNADFQFGSVVTNKAFATANGLQIIFTDAVFDGNSTAGRDGLVFFLADASQPFPKPVNSEIGGYLGYVNLAGGYLGIAFDEHGNFSSVNGTGGGGSGFPGQVPNTVAVRGAFATSDQYLGGYTGTTGIAQSLPFALSSIASPTRPAAPPTMRMTLTAAGLLTVEVDPHDGNGYRMTYDGTIVGLNGQPALPANVYLGFASSTGSTAQVHQIEGLTVAALTAPSATPTPVPTPVPSFAPVGAPILSESFRSNASTPNLWKITGDSCLTAGGATTPSTSIPACGSAAPVDTAGAGALQLTTNADFQFGAAVSKVPLNTARGFQVIFTDAVFDGNSTAGRDGLAVFLADASQAFPAPVNSEIGGYLGYVNLAGGYLGIAFDEHGNFSSVNGTGGGGSGFPGQVPNTVAVRGAFSTGNQYLGGYTGTTGTAQSLPFPLAATASATRPAAPPTMRITLTPAGFLTVEIDPHDGLGYRTTYNATIAGVLGQPALPAQVYLGFASSTGSTAQVHQIYGLTVTPLAPPAMSFTPKQIPNLAAWYDASDSTTIAKTGNAVSSWNDKSGNGNTLVQSATAAMPLSGQTIDGLGALDFTGTQFLMSSNAALSNAVFNASTTFVVTNGVTTTTPGAVISAGAAPPANTPRFELRLYDTIATHFDFNNKLAGRLSTNVNYPGPAFWTAAGSATTEYLRKDGNTVATGPGPGATVSGAYPLSIGGNLAADLHQGGPYYGTVGEVLVFNRYLSTAESQEVEGYLACKWGLQNRLPENHPYRAQCPGAVAAAPLPTPSPAASAIPVLPEIRSANGQLALTVVAQADASGNPHLTYNGSTVLPTLRLLPGDILSVTLTNNLPAMPAGSAYLNDTNLHFHGLHVSPNAPGDDSIDMLAMPGQTLNYQFAIPYNHPTGLYWYHSHAHGEVERQNLDGMSGAIVIDGIAASIPAVANMPERVLVVRDAPLPGQILPNADHKQLYAMGWAMAHANKSYGAAPLSLSGSRGMMTMGKGTAVRTASSVTSRNPYVTVDPKYRRFVRRPRSASDGHCVGAETAVKNWTINGVTRPSIGIRPGEQQFWRVVNAGSDTYLDLAVDNAQLQVVAIDGEPLTNGIGAQPTLTVNDYVVPPASRVEFIVTGPPAGTTAYLRTLCFDAGAAGPAMPATTLAVINPNASLSDQLRHRQRVSPKAVAYHFPRRLTRGLGTRFTTVAPTRSQTIYYSDQNTINGQAYDPAAAPQFYAQSGTVEEWTIVNNSSQVHTFHIHQIHFLVEAINGVNQSPEYVMDNVNVPAVSAAGPGTVKILLDFTDPLDIGTFLLHCHILSHEDAGMMAKIRVGTTPPLTTTSSAVTFTSAAAPAQNVTVGGGLAPYSISGCGGVANGTITGATVQITPTGAGSCIFTVSDASGLSATISVSVGSAPVVVSVTPAALSFASAAAPAQNASIAGGTPPYSVTGCTGIANAAINTTENGVSVAPVAPGTCALTVTDSLANTATLAISVNILSTGGPADNITFHHDTSHTGWYPAETTLTTTNVASTAFGLVNTLTAPAGMPAMGKVYAQPLYVQNQATSDGKTHNLIIVATSTDQIYAFDETTGAVVWETNFTNPAAGIRQQLFTDTGCDDVNPNVGITGTPVIDRTLNRLYVVVPTYENGVFHTRLHAISIASGADAVSPVEVTASAAMPTGGTATTDALKNFNRSSLLEANGNIYVPLGSHCDFFSATTHGWLLAYSASTLAATGSALDSAAANNGSATYLGSLWAGGFGPAADAAGNIYFDTGNGPYNGVTDFAMSAIRVPGNLDLTKASTFTPYGEAVDSAADNDFGSGGVVLLPTLAGAYPRVLVVGGKCGSGSATGGTQGCQKYLLNRDSLGGFSAGDAGALWHAATGGGLWGGPATFQDAKGNTYVVLGGGTPISTYTVGLNPISLTVQSAGNPGCLECRDQGSQPVISSNGTLAGTAVVWALKTPGNSGGNISLYAFDALNMNHTLFTGVAGTWTVGAGASYIGGALVSPTVANGRVYVPTDGGVAVFGIHP
jgi:FtsP/CotA-like multicopper oxidase with cupredoxin domain